jgi:biotin carboxyl carrier protein
MAQEIISAPIPGKVININVDVGAQVSEGDTICEIESMKMENPILTPVSGKVTKIDISLEQVVNEGETLAVIEY